MTDHKLPEFNSPYLTEYLRMVEDTESPRLYHLWAAITGLGTCLGRRVYLPFGPYVIYPNQFVLFVGNPGTRKSTSMSIIKRLLKESTSVRFAPQDTAGQRQGLVMAMQADENKEMLNGVELAVADNSLASIGLDEIAESDNRGEVQTIDPIDRHSIFVAASEFSRFIGQNNIQMLDFLVTMWDGEDYEYKTKQGTVTLENPLINLLGCTTPTSLAGSLPAAAGGQGFLSRIILVYGSRKYKSVPRPSASPIDSVNAIKGILSAAYHNLGGPSSETREARSYSEELYDYQLEITDSRFDYYRERRFTHLLKLGIILAATRGSTEIVKDDYDEGHRILRATESGMPDALGEFGLSPLAQVKQKILEFCRGLGQPISVEVLRQAFHRDARPADIIEATNDLISVGQLISSHNTNNEILVSARKSRKDADDEIFNLLKEK